MAELRIGIVLILLFNSCLSSDKSNEVARNIRNELIIRLNNLIGNDESIVEVIAGTSEVVVMTVHKDHKRTFYYVVPVDSTDKFWKTGSPLNDYVEEIPGWDSQNKQLYCTSKFGGRPLYVYEKSSEFGNWKSLSGVPEMPYSFLGILIENGNLYCKGYMRGIFAVSLKSQKSFIRTKCQSGSSRYSHKAIGNCDSLSILSGCWNNSEAGVLCLNQNLDSVWGCLYSRGPLYESDPFRVIAPISLVVDDSICMISTGKVLECRRVENGEIIWSRILEGYSCNMIVMNSIWYVLTYDPLTKENYFYTFDSKSPSSLRKCFSYFAEGSIEMFKHYERIIIDGSGKLWELVNSNNTYSLIEVFVSSEESREVIMTCTDQISGYTRFIVESDE